MFHINIRTVAREDFDAAVDAAEVEPPATADDGSPVLTPGRDTLVAIARSALKSLAASTLGDEDKFVNGYAEGWGHDDDPKGTPHNSLSVQVAGQPAPSA